MNLDDAKQDITETIYKASIYLDECNWMGWLKLCDKDFYYSINAYSPEINKDMIYLDGDFEQMSSLTEMLPKHNTDHSPLMRHTVVYTVDIDKKNKTAVTISSFALYQTQLDGINSHVLAGETNLFMVGKYKDKFNLKDESPLFVERTVQLDTRRLDKGTHWPI